MHSKLLLGRLPLILACLLVSPLSADDKLIYERDVAPLLTKYCAGCHNAQEAEGEANLDSLAGLAKGSENGPLIEKGNASASRLIQLIEGTLEPTMPPEDEPSPTPEEIQVLRDWIDSGMASNPKFKPEHPAGLSKLSPAPEAFHIVSAATAVADQLLLGKLGRVEAWKESSAKPTWTNSSIDGKVNSIRLSRSQQLIAAGGGRTGVLGEVLLLDIQGKTKANLQGHQDAIYSVAISPDETLVATGSYDHSIILWNIESGEKVHELSGHNGAIYDLDFDLSGQVLASASADQTVKLWNVKTGQRLDTLGQPEGEMYCVRFSPDGSYVYAAGADKQIRKWQVISRSKPSINPLLVARYAAEGDILQIACKDDLLISTSADKKVKAWSLSELQPLGTLCTLEDDPVGLNLANSDASYVVEIDGSKRAFTLFDTSVGLSQKTVTEGTNLEVATVASTTNEEIQQLEESEPNDTFADAPKIDVPAQLKGTISASKETALEDNDLFRFAAQAGEKWIIEAKADGDDSKLDCLVDVLNEYGEPVVRCRLQALRETYFTFRGKDSGTSDDFRLHRWEDMELDEYLYANGEVTRLWLYPRGPDSGFKVYPGFGSRYTFFGTTALSHALGEPAYIVRELGRGEEPLPNGLPVFTIYFENDDDTLRRSGKNSRLEFVAPEDGDYFVRLRDARGFEDKKFAYQLTIRRPQPDFQLKLSAKPMKVPVGMGQEWKIEAKRMDGFNGQISVTINDLPENFLATNPVIIEAGQETALGTIFAKHAADQSEAIELSLTASAEINGAEVSRDLKDKLTVQIAESSGEISLQLVEIASGEPIEQIDIHPGQTVSAKLIVDRNGEKRRIGLGKEDAGRNLPHGAFVDNIGLNGLLIPEEQTEREFFITAAPKVQPGKRQFHLRSDTKNNPTSRPIWLNVLPNEQGN